MKISETTVAVWSDFGLTTAAEEWIEATLAECAEACALDFKARFRERWPELASRTWCYVTVDGERVDWPTTEQVQAILSGGSTPSDIDQEGF